MKKILEKSGKSQGILSEEKSGNSECVIRISCSHCYVMSVCSSFIVRTKLYCAKKTRAYYPQIHACTQYNTSIIIILCDMMT